MTSTEPIIIPLSKRKMTLLLIGSLIFVVLGVLFAIDPSKYASVRRTPTFIFIAGVASILFFSACTFFISRKLLDTKPGLVIDNIGLTNNSSGASAGQIFWRDIKNISVLKIHKQRLIMLEVNNPQEYIDKQTSGFKKKLMRMSMSMYGTPFSITSNALQIKFDELLKILNDSLNESRRL